MTWRVDLVSIDDTTGVVTAVATFPQATVQSVAEILNDIGTASFSLPLHDPKARLIQVLPKPPARKEIQIWEGREIRFWGIVVGARADDAQVTFSCQSLELYLRQRRPGPGSQVELINNPSFENSAPLAAPTGWTDVTAVGTGYSVAAGPITGGVVLGNQCLLGAASAAGDEYFEQVIIIAAPASAGMRVEISAWWKAYFGFAIGDTYQNRGLFVVRLTWPGLALIDINNAGIDSTSRDEVWRRASVNTSVPAGTAYALAIRLYVPAGTLLWDAVSFRRKFVTYTVNGEDRSVLARRLVEQAAMGGVVANAQGGGPNGDLEAEILHPPVFIRWDAANPLTGVTSPVSIDHDSSTDFLSLLQDFPRQGLADFSIDVTDGTRRFFRLHAPTRGNYQPKHALQTGKNIVNSDYAVTGANVADQLVPPRADWASTLPSPSLGDRDIWAQPGLTSEANLNSIEEFIPIEVARRAEPVPVSSIRVKADCSAARALGLGDTVPVRIDDGYKQVDETLRILARQWLPASGELVYSVGRP